MEQPSARWDPVPEGLRPMLCVAGELPTAPGGWATEFKWDGVRAVVLVEGSRVRVRSRSGLEVTSTYPELSGLGQALGARQVALDGEIVAFDAHGRPSFEVLQARLGLTDAASARRLSARVPVSYLAFDLLHLDGRSALGLPYHRRRRLLESLRLAGDHWATPASHREAPAVVLAAARRAGLEGVVCKRLASPYRPGQRAGDWVKIRLSRTQEVVIGGYTPGAGRRSALGALIVGIPTAGGLRYVGKVGTGFSETQLAELASRLARLERRSTPFVGELPMAQLRGARWVRPVLVGEVRFSEWTRAGRLRQPSWRGLRPDKAPAEVTGPE